MKLIILIAVWWGLTVAQENPESKMNEAFQNAKKGVYYALSNIPDKKSNSIKELIDDDKLIAKVKLEKEVAGIRIE